MNSVVPQMTEKRLRDIPLVGIQLTEHFVGKRVNDSLVPVIMICILKFYISKLLNINVLLNYYPELALIGICNI